MLRSVAPLCCDLAGKPGFKQRLNRKRDEGKAILIVSTELDEIFALSDRILVMFDGRIVAELKASETTPTEVGLYMAGKAA